MIELARKGKLSQLKDIVATGGVNINYVDAAFGWSALAHVRFLVLFFFGCCGALTRAV